MSPAAGQAGQANVSLQQAGVPLIPAAIALEMSECDVVKRAGVAEKVDIGANDQKIRTRRDADLYPGPASRRL